MKKLKMVKKLIIYTLICSMLLSTAFITGASAASEKVDIEAEFLTYIGLANVNASAAGGAVTRAEAATWLAQALGMDKAFQATTQIFSDVDITHQAAAAIGYLYENNIVHGNTDGTFRPDANVSFNEFAKMTTAALGYEEYASVKGGYIRGYLDCARSSGITKSVATSGDFTKGKLWRMLYNMLHAQRLVPVSVTTDPKTGENTLTYEKGDTLIKEIYGLTKYSGVVMSGSTGCIYGSNLMDDGMVMIDYETYRVVNKTSKDLLGLTVDYYLNESDLVEFMVTGDNEKTTVMYDKILSDTTVSRFGYEDAGKNKKYLNVDSDAFYSYNGMQFFPASSDLKPKYGKVELIDNDGDKKIDVVKIWDYRSYVTSSVSTEKVYLEENDDNLRMLDLSDSNVQSILLDRAMNICDFNLLDKNNVITVAKSKDGSFQTIMMSSDVFEGTLSAITGDGKAVIDDYEYDIYTGLDIESVFSKPTNFYLDVNDTIVKFDEAKEEKTAILYGVMMTSDIDGQMSFKFYDSGKFDVYESAAKIQLSTGGETFTAYNQEDAYRVIKDAYDAKGKQLIQYTLKDNKVNKLIFAEETSVSNDDRFQLNKTLKQADYTVYREYIYEKDASADSMEYIRWLPRAGYVYIVSNTEKNCNYGLFNNVYNAMGNNYTISKEYEISAYNVSEVGYAEYTVVKEREGTAGSEVMPDVNWQNSDIAIISDKEIVVDDSGEPTVSFTAFACDSQSQGAKTIKLRARESDLRNSEKADNTDGTIPSFGEGQTNIYEQNTINFNDLRPGDVIRYTMDSLTQTVSGFALVCAKEHLTSNWACKSYTGANWIGVTTGTVVAKSDLGVKIYGSHINSGIYGNYLTSARCEYTNRDLVVVYNTKDETMKMGSWDDIQEDAKLWHYRDGTYTWGGSVWMIFE